MGAPERRPPDDPREWLNRAIQYAVTTRYPHLEQPVDEREYAEAVVCWAAKRV